MTRTAETSETSCRQCCTREQARELLEGLRDAYNALSSANRALVKSIIADSARKHSLREAYEEKECFELAC
jgi:hypothetical protein